MKLFLVSFITSLALLTAVQTRLAAQRYTQEPGHEAVLSTDPAATKSFDQVKFFSHQNLASALKALRVMANRICVIVPVGDTYQDVKKGEILSATRTSEFMLMLADRDFTANAGQMTGTPTSPGILALKDLTIQDFLTQPLVIGGRAVVVRPGAGAIVQMEWKEGDTALIGRESWHQLFHADAGHMRVEIGRRS